MRILSIFFFIFSVPHFIYADALVINKAMKSPTIAQYYVKEEGVRLELEIGMKDLQKFADLYPNSLRKVIGLDESPLKERGENFLHKKLAVRVDEKVLPGFITSIYGGKKIMRDPITGEPLPIQAEEAPSVLYLTVEYPFFTLRPKSLDLLTDLNVNIGFILYHEDQPVNDFRFLTQEQRVNLDWNDPFYSKFTAKPLLRQYRYPMSFFLYIEPYEVRKEFVLRPKDLQSWIDLGIQDKEVLTLADQERIKTKVAEFLMQRAKTTIDGKEIPVKLDRIHFIERTLKRSGVITPPRELLSSTATLGVIYTYAVNATPKEVVVEWDLFNEKINYVPVTTTDQAGPFYHFLEPDVPKLTWQNYIRFPKDHSINTVRVENKIITLPWLALLLIILFIVVLRLYLMRKKKSLLLLAALSLVAALVSWPLVKVDIHTPLEAKLDKQEAKLLLHELLSNVYRSFVFKEEGAIYDALSKSVDGDLLSEIYLQVKRSLELKNQGGAEASVDAIEIKDMKLIELDNGYALESSWDVNGSVGHWGHIHQRANHYEAEFVIEPVNKVWKIKTMKVYNEERIK